MDFRDQYSFLANRAEAVREKNYAHKDAAYVNVQAGYLEWARSAVQDAIQNHPNLLPVGLNNADYEQLAQMLAAEIARRAR